MQWSEPDFVEISLRMEVTAYVNTDEAVKKAEPQTPIAPPVSESSVGSS
jgi:coenzyme PQQ precursor peptide PqqA